MNLYHGADHFRASDDDRQPVRPVENTEPTEVMIQTLMAHVRAQFYTAWPEKRWLQEQKHMLMILTWPATWLNQRGISLPLDQYEKILREIIVGIQRHGATATVKFFPAYFEHTVKQWFVHNGESLYEDRKAIRNALDLRFLKGLTPTVPKTPDPMEALAAANRVLATARRKTKVQSDPTDQLSLL